MLIEILGSLVEALRYLLSVQLLIEKCETATADLVSGQGMIGRDSLGLHSKTSFLLEHPDS